MVAAIGFLAGVLIAMFTMHWRSISYQTRNIELSTAVEILSTITALEAFHRNEVQNGILLLDTHLNSRLTTFCAYPAREKESLVALRKAKQYREKHPFQGGNKETEALIDAMLSKY